MTVKKQGAWGLWWLCGITFGIYYLVWYERINQELAAILRREQPSDGRWWSQFIPIYGWIGLWRTAKRVNEAHASVGSPTRVSPAMAAIWAALWFASHTRYLQRRINILHDVLASHAAKGFNAAPSVAPTRMTQQVAQPEPITQRAPTQEEPRQA